MELLRLFESGKIIINFDESALSSLDCRHHAWFKKGCLPIKPDYYKVKQI